MTKTACTGCGKYCITNTMICVDSNLICTSCFNNNTQNCYTCNKYIMSTGRFLCDICNSYYFICKITDKLYLSDYKASICYDILKNIGIKQILSIGTELPEHKTNDFKLKHIKIDDHSSVDIMQYFEETYNFIDAGVTLVHCYAGVSRSATVVISYLMKKYNQPLQFAYDYCKKVRPFIAPNKGFMIQLTEYENILREKNLEKINKQIAEQINRQIKYQSQAEQQATEQAKLEQQQAKLEQQQQATEQAKLEQQQQATEQAKIEHAKQHEHHYEHHYEQVDNYLPIEPSDTPDIINICDNIFSASINGTDIKLTPLGINILEYLYK